MCYSISELTSQYSSNNLRVFFSVLLADPSCSRLCIVELAGSQLAVF